MKTNKLQKNNGFTLIEMVGVLAVIAILAALLVPKIFAAINDSRFSNTVASLNTAKTATMDYFGKTGSFPVPQPDFSTNLINANCMERPLACKIAPEGSWIEVVDTKGGVANAGYKLDGTSNITYSATTVVQCILTNVAGADAYELSRRMDGQDLSSSATTADSVGRVTYALPDTDGLTKVYVYVAHR